jgi:hypothetical protein
VNEFVEECRREWKRLGVPDPVADEMAADLAADLREAEAEGVSPEEVLGSGVFDARSFAGAWAAERGVAREPPPSGRRTFWRPRLPSAIAIAPFALVALAGAVLTIVSSGSQAVRVALPSPAVSEVLQVGPRQVQVGPIPVPVRPPPWAFRPRSYSVPVPRGGPPRFGVLPVPPRVVQPFPIGPAGRVLAFEGGGWGGARVVGVVLLILGVVGMLISALAWPSAGPGHRSLRRI